MKENPCKSCKYWNSEPFESDCAGNPIPIQPDRGCCTHRDSRDLPDGGGIMLWNETCEHYKRRTDGKRWLIERRSDREMVCRDDRITVRCVREWLARLPKEFQDVEFETVFGGLPVNLKRVVAYRAKDGSCKGVTVNGMGSHLPFDDSLEWVLVLS